MTENSTAMKKVREYKRLIMAIKEEQPEELIRMQAFEYLGCRECPEVLDKLVENTIKQAREDAKKYFAHYQGGKPTLVFKRCPLGAKLTKGEFKPSNEEA